MKQNTIGVYGHDGSKVNDLALECSFDGAVTNPVANAICARVINNNSKIETACTKNRGEVAYSTRKPWKQKGTGRARTGTAGSCIWRGGGVCFGPRGEKRQLQVNRKMIRNALSGLVATAVEQNRVKMLANLEFGDKPSTKYMANCLANVLGARFVEGKEKVAFFLHIDDHALLMSIRNLTGVSCEFYGRQDLVSLAKCGQWIFLEKDKELFENMVMQWS